MQQQKQCASCGSTHACDCDDVINYIYEREELSIYEESYRPRELKQRGFVYLIRAGVYHKIGVTRNIKKRLQAIQRGVPDEVILIASGITNDFKSWEHMLHESLKHKRVRGEWFLLTDEEVAEYAKHIRYSAFVDCELLIDLPLGSSGYAMCQALSIDIDRDVPLLYTRTSYKEHRDEQHTLYVRRSDKEYQVFLSRNYRKKYVRIYPEDRFHVPVRLLFIPPSDLEETIY